MVQRSQHGYTLLELLVAITLVATLSVLLTSGLHLGAQVWQKSDKRREAWMDLASGYQFLKGRFTAVVPIQTKGATGGNIVSFQGETDRVTFINTDLGKAGFLGDQLMTLAVESEGATSKLVVYRKLYTGTFSDNSAGKERLILLPKIGGLTFSYFGAMQPGQAPSWQETWENAQLMPQLVRAKLDDSRSSAKQTWVFALPQR